MELVKRAEELARRSEELNRQLLRLAQAIARPSRPPVDTPKKAIPDASQALQPGILAEIREFLDGPANGESCC